MPKIIINKKYLKLFFWLGLLALIFLFHFNHFLDADEGVTLNGAWNLYNGQIMYKDFFAFIPPASFYLIFFLWKITGPSFLAAKLFSIFTIWLGAIGVYKISQKTIDSKYTLVIPFLFVTLLCGSWPTINHNTFNIVAIIWATFFFIKALDHKNKLDIIWSGLLTGLSMLFLQQKGGALFVVSALFLIILYFREKNKIYLQNLIQYLITALLPLSLLLFWPIKTIFYDLLIFPLVGYKTANQYPLTLLVIFGIIWITTLIFLIIKKEKSPKIWFLLLTQLFLLVTTYALPDLMHISQIEFPTLILSFVLLSRLLIKIKDPAIKIIIISAILTGILSLLLLNLTIFSGFSLYSFQEKNGLIEKIKNECPGKYIYVGPFLPNIYFESGKIMATPYDILISTQYTTQQFLEAKNYMIKNQPSCAVLAYPNYLKRFRHDPNNAVENYIRDNYHKIWDDNEISIYKK